MPAPKSNKIVKKIIPLGKRWSAEETLRPKSTTKLAISDRDELFSQIAIAFDVTHAEPAKKGSGKSLLESYLTLEWFDPLVSPGYWSKHLNIVNKSSSPQKVVLHILKLK